MFSLEIMGADGLRWALRSSKSLVPVLPPGRWVRLPRAPAILPVPTSLLERADGTALREAWRQFLHASVMPVSLSVSAELSEKLDTDIRLSFDRMFASDLSGRARAFQSMVGGGMDVQKAAALAGLMEPER